jgi:hypothetical protein
MNGASTFTFYYLHTAMSVGIILNSFTWTALFSALRMQTNITQNSVSSMGAIMSMVMDKQLSIMIWKL